MKYKDITALIADDEAHMRTFIKLILTDLGIEKIEERQNGREAVDAYKTLKPQLVLLDINMNLMSGLDALDEIREIDPNSIVIMMTAVSTRDAVERSSESGATYYILKTQAPDDIKERIREVIEAVLIPQS